MGCSGPWVGEGGDQRCPEPATSWGEWDGSGQDPSPGARGFRASTTVGVQWEYGDSGPPLGCWNLGAGRVQGLSLFCRTLGRDVASGSGACRSWRRRTQVSVSVAGEWSPVQQLPVLTAPLVPELLSIHASHALKVGLVDPKEAEAIHLPVTWGQRVPLRLQVLRGPRTSEGSGAGPIIRGLPELTLPS